MFKISPGYSTATLKASELGWMDIKFQKTTANSDHYTQAKLTSIIERKIKSFHEYQMYS